MTGARNDDHPEPAPPHIGGWIWSARGRCGIAPTRAAALACMRIANAAPAPRPHPERQTA